MDALLVETGAMGALLVETGAMVALLVETGACRLYVTLHKDCLQC